MNGEMTPIVFSGTLNGDFFKAYIADCLAPTLSSGDIVVMDNLSSHKVAGIIDPIMEKGATVQCHYLKAQKPPFGRPSGSPVRRAPSISLIQHNFFLKWSHWGST